MRPKALISRVANIISTDERYGLEAIVDNHTAGTIWIEKVQLEGTAEEGHRQFLHPPSFEAVSYTLHTRYSIDHQTQELRSLAIEGVAVPDGEDWAYIAKGKVDYLYPVEGRKRIYYSIEFPILVAVAAKSRSAIRIFLARPDAHQSGSLPGQVPRMDVIPSMAKCNIKLSSGKSFRLKANMDHSLLDFLVSRSKIVDSLPQDEHSLLMGEVLIPPKKTHYLRKVKMIKILFLAANPVDTTRLRLDKEVRSIDEALRKSDYGKIFDIRQHWAVRVSDIQNHLLRHRPDIVHFSGHGSEQSAIILENESGKSQPVTPRALMTLFAALKDNIRVIVLNACYSEQQAQAIAEHIDCVIGMSEAIGDEAAISFATAFYQALGFGRDVKTGFDLGRVQLDMLNLDEHDVPVLIAKKIDSQKVVFV